MPRVASASLVADLFTFRPGMTALRRTVMQHYSVRDVAGQLLFPKVLT